MCNLNLCSQKLWEDYGIPIARVIEGGDGYKTKAVRLNQETAERLMGSSTAIGDEVYLHVWLIADHKRSNVGILVGGERVGELPAAKSKSLQQPKQYLTSEAEPLACGPAIVQVPARLVVEKGSKRTLYVCAVESPQDPPAKSLPFATTKEQFADITGHLSNAMLDARGITCRQAIAYVRMSDSEARRLRNELRNDPSGAKYFFLPSDLMTEYPIIWRSDDRRYEVIINIQDPRNSEILEHTFRKLEVKWIHGIPPQPTGVQPPESVVEPQSKTPVLWRDLGRTATLTLNDHGKQVAVDPCDSEFCHCWSWVQGLSYPNKDGSSRVVIANQLNKGEQLTLRHEPDNPHDSNAIAVRTQRQEQLGYLPRPFARELVRENFTLSAYVRERTTQELGSGAVASSRIELGSDGSM